MLSGVEVCGFRVTDRNDEMELVCWVCRLKEPCVVAKAEPVK